MKILELRLKNLNSLYGEWLLDFTYPEYSSDGIFALTGPTGAGKSTILDALCLALYGETPRLGRITKSGNEIMSRQTGECSAEVLFESEKGKFRCSWAQHRARRKADGKLADTIHEISDAKTGKLIESKKSLVLSVIEEKTGMDFDRFTRSILLAQGSFDTFLKATDEEKSKILEQITGTDIYTHISRQVHEKLRDEKEKLNIIQAETSGIIILDKEEEEEIRKQLENKTKEEIQLAEKSEKTEKALSWLNGIEVLKNEIESLSTEAVDLEEEILTFQSERMKLEKAVKAAVFDGEYASLERERKQLDHDINALREEEIKKPEIENEYKNILKELENQDEINLEIKSNIKKSAPLIKKVRYLDQNISESKKHIQKGTEEIEKLKSELQTKSADKKNIENNLNITKNELKTADEYLIQHSEDKELISSLTGIEEQLNFLQTKQKELNIKKNEKSDLDLFSINKDLTELQKNKSELKKQLKEAESINEKANNGLQRLLDGKLLREYRKEKEGLLREFNLYKQIESLEQYRNKLKDGSECPLCGSKEHPFASGNIPEKNKTEEKIEFLTNIINNAEAQEDLIKKSETELNKLINNFNEEEKNEAVLLNNKNTAEKINSDIKINIKEIQKDIADIEQNITVKLEHFGINDSQIKDPHSLLNSLKKRLEKWKEYNSDKDKTDKNISDLKSESEKSDIIIKTLTDQILIKENELKILETEYQKLLSDRYEIFSDKNPDIEEKELENRASDSENIITKLRISHDKIFEIFNTVQVNIKSLGKRIDKNKIEVEFHESSFIKNIQVSGFNNEKQFAEARIPAVERELISNKAKNLDIRITELKARKKDRESRLSLESEKNITDMNINKLKIISIENQTNLVQIRDINAEMKHRLKDNESAKDRIKERRGEINLQKNECIRWEKLHSLIGSADGKKFRNFAQGITFEIMVAHANRQLEKMSDRYILIRDSEDPLSLNVADNYQAGEIRSVRNLSGGESFIISLSLALGLSKMASRKVRVDSLFLDEGFGSLDEDALETALETLSSLQQDGKLIGVISHISALKERITTQIEVSPLSGGKSSLSGPGCRAVI